MVSRVSIKRMLSLACIGFALIALVRRSEVFKSDGKPWTLVGTLILMNQQSTTHNPATEVDSVECSPGVPCQYPETVDFRIIVLAYNRPDSLLLLLHTLDRIELDGDEGRLEVFIDRSSSGEVSNGTVEAARGFSWSRGRTRVHVQRRHVGIYGQWIDSWSPQLNSTRGLREIVLILEDDMLVSPYIYRWLKAVHAHYGNVTDFFGATLTSDVPQGQQTVRPRLFSQTNVTVFFHKFAGTWGTSPAPKHWHGFQRWFRSIRATTPDFKPYIPGTLLTTMYKNLERAGKAHTMWSQWLSYYTYKEKLFTIYNNLEMYNNGSRSSCLSVNRRAAGLHFARRHEQQKPYCKLLTTWRPDFIEFPSITPLTDWDGSIISKY